jgi:cellulose synthase/poly-beta-1,6-N-acetylglucosamine synthase-like glycosyltransferase
MKPKLTVVILTLNEAKNIRSCLRSLAAQDEPAFETIIIDAASTDGTVNEAISAAAQLQGPFRIHADSQLLPIGAARNMGVQMASAPYVAFLSADAELMPDWIRRALCGLEKADLVFGRQVMEPRRWTGAAAVRSMRYMFPSKATPDACRFASNVAGAYRREVLLRFPFDADTNAAEDLLIARRAARAGHRVAYDHEMVVVHHDVDTARAEMRKNVREGQGWARYRAELGMATPWLAWGLALSATAVSARIGRIGVAAFAGMLWAPALRRAMRNHRGVPGPQLVQGIVMAPLFDAAFLASYLKELLNGRSVAEPALLDQTVASGSVVQ